jgi:hypothetical protein
LGLTFSDSANVGHLSPYGYAARGGKIKGLAVVKPFAEAGAVSTKPGEFSADLDAVCGGDVLAGELEARRPA